MNRPLDDVSRETMEKLEHYAQLVQKWNPKINLVSKSSLEVIWERHIVDSAQTAQLGSTTGHWVDLGSGGGFPGIVAAVFGQGTGAQFTLVESDQRKSAFLRTVVRELDLPARVLTDRIEQLASLQADVLSARALSDLDSLLDFADLHLKVDGIALFPKGSSWQGEEAQARKRWSYHCTPVTSQTNAAAAILKIKDIRRV